MLPSCPLLFSWQESASVPIKEQERASISPLLSSFLHVPPSHRSVVVGSYFFTSPHPNGCRPTPTLPLSLLPSLSIPPFRLAQLNITRANALPPSLSLFLLLSLPINNILRSSAVSPPSLSLSLSLVSFSVSQSPPSATFPYIFLSGYRREKDRERKRGV